MSDKIAFVADSLFALRILARWPRSSSLRVLALFTESVSPELDDALRSATIARHDLSELPALLPALGIDWLFHAGTRFYFPDPLLRAARKGALNVHPGKLPEYAGLHSTQWAIRNGESATAATLHWMTSEIDAGPVALEAPVAIQASDSGLSVWLRTLDAAADLVAEAARLLASGGALSARRQDLSRRKVYPEGSWGDGRVEWTMSSRQIVDFVRAADYSPLPSPTYRPWFNDGQTKVGIFRARVGGATFAGPGQVLERGRELRVACGRGESVLITPR